MSSMSEDIQCAGPDTHPPMLDRTDFESWQQRVRLYCLGKDNGENIMKSINEGPFHMGTASDVIAGGNENAVQQDEKNKVAIGYKNPLCLTRAKQAQSALYNGHVLVTTNHTPTVIHDSEDTREIAEITRKRMLLKMQSPLGVNASTEARGSNTKKNRILHAKEGEYEESRSTP
ncbi:hypothetical protein Tco_0668622 [Tanacetum coccineum]